MAKHYAVLWFAASILCCCSFAYASEDTASPFPDGMLITDLPDLPPLEESNAVDATQVTPLDVSPVMTDVIDIPVIDETNEVKKEDVVDNQNTTVPLDTSLPNETTPSQEKTVEVPEESDKPNPIFLPKTDNTASAETDKANISTKQSLTENLKKDKPQNIIEGTWIEKLASVNPLSAFDKDKGKDDLAELVKRARGKNKDGRSNASVFDISGLMLRMNLNQVEKTMRNRGFQKINAKFTIPNFIKWRNEEACNAQGIVGFERQQSCITSMAKKDGHEYLYYAKYAKFDSKEDIEVFFTSNFTDNKVHKIIYRSGIPAVAGNSPKAIYLRNIKVYDFWKKINQKYGTPDNKNNVTWGLGGNKPFLKASTGYLLLEDPMFVEMDYTRMSREDQRFIHSDYYNF